MDSDVSLKYIEVLQRYFRGEIDHITFQHTYLTMMKQEKSHLSVEVYSILQELFWVVESYCSDPTLRDPEDADESAMYQAAVAALSRLEHRTSS